MGLKPGSAAIHVCERADRRRSVTVKIDIAGQMQQPGFQRLPCYPHIAQVLLREFSEMHNGNTQISGLGEQRFKGSRIVKAIRED